MIDFLVTSAAFLFSAALIPLLLQSYLGLKIFNFIYVKCLSMVYPELQFVKETTTRILLDTHRNQGIYCVFLSVKGEAQPDYLKRHLQEVVKRKDKFGNSVFPRLKQTLLTRCGMYAWHRGKFDLNQHVVVSPASYRGRNISEINIQDYASHIVSKYLQPGIPPWQITIIPSTEDQHYILLKLHHILLNEGLNIADLLPLIPPVRQSTGQQIHTPLLQVFKTPESIPYLQERLAEEFTNKWNEFISNYDPLECPEILKNGPGFYQYLAIMLIAMASTVKECRRDFNKISNDPLSKLKFVYSTWKRESSKRHLTFRNFLIAILLTVDPRNVFMVTFKYFWYITVSLMLRTPILIYQEVGSLYGCLTLSYCPYPNTVVGIIYKYVPLFYYATQEAFYCFKIIFKAPRFIIEDVFFGSKALQNVTLCGRKVVAWSHPVKTDYIKTIANKIGISEIEVMLAAISSSMSRYLSHTNRDEMPEDLPITLINISSSYIFSTGTNVKPTDSVSGMLCLKLPILISEKQTNIVANTTTLTENFGESMRKQSVVYLLSLLQIKKGMLTKLLPATVTTIILKYLCGKFPVSVTEVTSRTPNITQQTLWGQEVTSAIFWRPPQANISISLCFNEYAEHVRLGVMCDALMGPHHPDLIKGFPEHLKALSLAFGIE